MASSRLLHGVWGDVSSTPLQVDPYHHHPDDVGEEALLLARHAPTFKGIQRRDAVNLISPHPKTVILLDDGHSHHSLYKDFSILVVNGAQGIGNGCVFPGGPLREPLSSCLARADAVFVIQDPHQDMPYFLTKEISKTIEVLLLKSRFSCALPGHTPIVGFSVLGILRDLSVHYEVCSKT